MSEARKDEVVIVGGGLAGASAACLLAEAGRPVLLIERDAEPRDKVCGEFLSIEAQTYLAHLGVDLDALGASRISRLRLVRRHRLTEVQLPFIARGVSRRILDEVLLQRANSRGAQIVRGQTVKSIVTGQSRTRIDVGPHGSIDANTVFLATGKHDVRGMKREPVDAADDFIGFKMHYRLGDAQQKALKGAIEVILFTGGYAGLQMIEQSVANLCLVVSRRIFTQTGKTWDSLLDFIANECPHLAERLLAAQALDERPLAIFQIPYGYLHRPESNAPQGLFRLGDQAGVIPSFTGEGMSIALHSGCLAASTFLAHGNASSLFHNAMHSDLRRSIRIASILNQAVRHAAGQRAIFQICRIWPAAMRHVTTLTRLREVSMRSAFLAS